MFSPKGADLQRGWPGRIDGERVIQLAAQTLSRSSPAAGRPASTLSIRSPRSSSAAGAASTVRPRLLRLRTAREDGAGETRPRGAGGWYRIPVFYFSNPSVIYGPEAEIPYPDGTNELDYELEVAAVIGADGQIGGFTIMNDWSREMSGARR